MRLRGPLATLAAVAAAVVATIATNIALTAPSTENERPVTQLADVGAVNAAAPAGAVGYDGRSAGGEVTVTLQVGNDGRATARVCNGKGAEYGMQGSVADGRMQLTGDNGASLDATTDGRAAFGTASAAGKSWPFSAAVQPVATPVAPPAAPGPTSSPPTDGAGTESNGGY